MSTALGVVLTALLPSAPGLKADRLPKDLIDLIPEDTAGVLVLDVAALKKNEIGKTILDWVVAQSTENGPGLVDEIAKDCELIVIAQFLIDKMAGDFCFLVRFREGSDVSTKLRNQANSDAKKQIGDRTVFGLDKGISFTPIDPRTLMFVAATAGDDKEIDATELAAYGKREKRGPHASMRKLLDTDRPADTPVLLFGSHSSKAAHSAVFALLPFGDTSVLQALGARITGYRGHVQLKETLECEIRLATSSEASAKAALEAIKNARAPGEEFPFQPALRNETKFERDKDDVVITVRLTGKQVADMLRLKK